MIYRRTRMYYFNMEGSLACKEGHIARPGPLTHRQSLGGNGPILEKISLLSSSIKYVKGVGLWCNGTWSVFNVFSHDPAQPLYLPDTFPINLGLGNEDKDTKSIGDCMLGLDTSKLAAIDLQIETFEPLLKNEQLVLKIQEWLPQV